ncbi:hypothetical protein JHN55_06940 [Streptomyces sp. MBT56]|uniref:hypothetical protein n=1 Tax=unclassified Streptomyces TaxID=2593676 RepID=UPI00190A1D90|nr:MULTISPECIES: hypothetical protein [unclassified Streptomyces]MBK3556274.1 hypothetical protein [Streptomyces sp. MBT56]MBK3601260.1 hypothetical protein [Streptomyces sp. MBT54]MBK3619297.1 hypothetical protein [Streptomyces sp. MBT98]MBK6046888.1 hypothetical protein [Streptomyces sp. MBT55]
MRDRICATATVAAPPSEADEALQRARNAMNTETRTLMDGIGRALCSVAPTLAMREVTRLSYATRAAADLHGTATPRAVAATGLLLRHMPRVDWPVPPSPITRAEYGMQLIKKAGI